MGVEVGGGASYVYVTEDQLNGFHASHIEWALERIRRELPDATRMISALEEVLSSGEEVVDRMHERGEFLIAATTGNWSPTYPRGIAHLKGSDLKDGNYMTAHVGMWIPAKGSTIPPRDYEFSVRDWGHTKYSLLLHGLDDNPERWEGTDKDRWGLPVERLTKVQFDEGIAGDMQDPYIFGHKAELAEVANMDTPDFIKTRMLTYLAELHEEEMAGLVM